MYTRHSTVTVTAGQVSPECTACSCPQVRHNDAALEQLIDNAGAIPALVGLFDRGKDAVSEQAAQLMGLLTSRFNDAKIKAVKVGCLG
jgi:hypothetical protein